MKLFNYLCGGKARLGVFSDGNYYDAEVRGLDFARTDDVVSGAVALSDISFGRELSPGFAFAPAIDKPDKILCAGLNYRDHAEETGGTPPDKPVIFDKLTACLAACGEDIPAPPSVRCLDYEAELVAVVGKAAYNVTVEEAEECIFGYACGNDLSARDA